MLFECQTVPTLNFMWAITDLQDTAHKMTIKVAFMAMSKATQHP